MTEMPPAPDSVAIIDEMRRATDTSFATTLSARLEEWVRYTIEMHMRNDLSNTDKDRIFNGTGFLATFSAKIQLAYALEFIDGTTRSNLIALKDVRNAFSHSKQMIHFNSPEIRKVMQKFPGWNPSCNNQDFFVEKAIACLEVLKDQMRRITMVRLLREEEPLA